MESIIKCNFVKQDEISNNLKKSNTLGVVNFCETIPKLDIDKQIPVQSIQVGPQQTEMYAEIWTSTEAVKYCKKGIFQFAMDENNLFGCFSFPDATEQLNLEQITEKYYIELITHLAELGYPYIYRIWNYMSRINEEDSLERYRLFCAGRNNAFNNSVENFTGFLSAATGISKGINGTVDVYFLAQRKNILTHIENPLQTPAYNYPKQYGPKSPSFARATYISRNATCADLYISGTASIQQSETLHQNNLQKQFLTTIENLKSLVDKSNLITYGIDEDFTIDDINNLKVYYRNKEDLQEIQQYSNEYFTSAKEIMFINVDICRSDLLLEIEGLIHTENLGNKTKNKHVENAFMDIPTDRDRKNILTFKKGTVNFSIPPYFSDLLQTNAVKYKVNIADLLLTGIHALLHTYSGAESTLVHESEKYYTVLFNPNSSFYQIISQTNVLEYSKNDKLKPAEKQIIYNYGKELIPQPDDSYNNPPYEIFFSFNAHTNDISGVINYNTELYHPERINRLSQHFILLLDQMLRKPETPIGKLNILTEEEKKLFDNWNTNQVVYPLSTVIHLFEEQVRNHPDSTAIIFQNNHWTNAELENKVNELAEKIIKNSIQSGIRIGVCTERSDLTLIAMLAIWKSGNIYVPLDINYADSFIYHIIAESEITMIITTTGQESRLTINKNIDILYIDRNKAIQNPVSKVNIEILSPSAIFYTSGSTGLPKGVIVPHEYFLKRLHWSWRQYPFNTNDIVCQRTTVNFVVSTWEFLSGLLKGIPTVIIEDKVLKDPLLTLELIAASKITYLQVIPSLLKMFLSLDIDISKYLFNLRLLISCGEPLPTSLIKKLQKQLPELKIINQYGSSEVFDITCYDLEVENFHEIMDTVPIVPVGKAIDNTNIYILNEWMQPVPFGVAGELYVDSPGIALGYVANDTETSEKFIPNPFENKYGNTLYKMGDLGRYISNGNIEILGRKDNQIKINGIRVEIEGIEALLRDIEDVMDAGVVPHLRSNGSYRLIAYIVSSKKDMDEIRKKAHAKMPDYLVPAIFNNIDYLPLKPNGKLDRELLIKDNLMNSSVAKSTDENVFSFLKEQISTCFEVDQSLITDDKPLLELGGDSLVLVDLITAINKKFAIPLRVSDVFDFETLSKLGQHIQHLISGDNINSSAADTKNITSPVEPENKHKIAIIGVSGRFPDADNIDELWDLLKLGSSAIKEIPRERWKADEYYSADPNSPNKSISKWGGFLTNINAFDSLFFNISPKEAELMDPQQRIILEESWKAFEDAGYIQDNLSEKKVGVFMGVRTGDYQDLIKSNTETVEAKTLTGNDSSILSSRISYYFNLKGPAISVDTACSSSLTAIHLACKSILYGESEMCLAGGINIVTTPKSYIIDSKAGMLSPDGKCKTFDNEANGFVPGEAAGVILLKPYEKALSDGDQIYGVILASHLNQDGKTNGITAPSKQAQHDLQVAVYKNADIDPSSITYIEAHGTGTKLGDPIEVDALISTFRRWTNTNQFCGLGSVKTNLGHCVAAAGVVGLIKILLMFKNKQIPASLNCRIPNEQIDFTNSPFVLNKKLIPWEATVKRAAINSFGFSGTNVHMVLEQPPVIKYDEPELHPFDLFCISAKTEKSLKGVCQDLYGWLSKNKGFHLENISYTLNAKRTHFQHRIAIIAGSYESLMLKLTSFINDNTSYTDLEQSKWDQGDNSVDYTNKLIELRKDYLEGKNINWKKLYFNRKLQPVNLPHYSFEKTAYWIVKKEYDENIVEKHIPAVTRLDYTGADTSSIKYKASFFENQSYFEDHIIAGKKILPGAMLIEMVVKAIAETTGIKSNIKIKNLIWHQAISEIKNEISIGISLFKNNNGEIRFEIDNDSAMVEKKIYCTGVVSFFKSENNSVIDISTIRNRCIQHITSATCYDIFNKININYGLTHKCIDYIQLGNDESISKIELPSSIVDTLNSYEQHPSLMDAAMQAIIGFYTDYDSKNIADFTLLPYSIDELTLYSPLEQTMWSWVRSEENSSLKNKYRKVDIDIINTEGKVCVKMKGLSVLYTEKYAVQTVPEISCFSPVWNVVEDLGESHKFTKRYIILLEQNEVSSLTDNDDTQYIKLNSAVKSIEEKYTYYTTALCEILQGIIQNKTTTDILVQVIYKEEAENTLFRGVSGLLRTASLENPMIKWQVIGIDTSGLSGSLLKSIEACSEIKNNLCLRYNTSGLEIQEFEKLEIKNSPTLALKPGGVYVITGGNGKLGSLLAEWIIEKGQDIKLVLTSRSLIDENTFRKYQEKGNSRIEVVFQQVDVTSRDSVRKLNSFIETTYGKLNGIFHTAGIIQDNYLIKKELEEFKSVLRPKVHGLVYLDEESRAFKLDFLVCYSSISGVFGNIGQGDYSSANSFMDIYSNYRNSLVQKGICYGNTLSINWPLWEDGGMTVDDVTKDYLQKTFGMQALPSEVGMNILNDCLCTGHNQILIMSGNADQSIQSLNVPISNEEVLLSRELNNPTEKEEDESLNTMKSNTEEQILCILKKCIFQVLKINIEDIDTGVELDEYGFDSILFSDLANRLSMELDTMISPTLFFEFTSIDTIVEYLCKSELKN